MEPTVRVFGLHLTQVCIRVEAIKAWHEICLLARGMKSNPYSYISYREYLRDELKSRQSKLKRPYSLRSFSRLLGVSPSALSNVLSGKREFSNEALLEISKRLGLNDLEQEHILSLRSIEEGPTRFKSTTNRAQKSSGERVRFRHRLESRAQASRKKTYSGNSGNFLTAWYVLPFIEALDLPIFKQDLDIISKKLGVHVDVLKRLQDELSQHGVIIKNESGRWEKVGNFLEIRADGQVNHSLRRFYRQMLGVALDRIVEETTHERYLASETFAFDKTRLPEAREIIDRCMKELAALASRCDNPTTIYHAGMHLFEVLHKDRKTP